MSKFRSPMMTFSLSGCAFSQALVPLISGTHWKLIVRFGFGSLPFGDQLEVGAADFERQRAAGVVVVGALLDVALVEVAGDGDFLRRAAVAGNLGVDDLLLPGTVSALMIERIVTFWPRPRRSASSRPTARLDRPAERRRRGAAPAVRSACRESDRRSRRAGARCSR